MFKMNIGQVQQQNYLHSKNMREISLNMILPQGGRTRSRQKSYSRSGGQVWYRESRVIIVMNQVVTEQTGEGFYVAQFKTTQLAIFSYYIESQQECLLIDPVFDIDLYEKFFIDRKSKLKYVFLTHYHADFLSGHTEFKVPIIMGPTSTRKINTFKVHECTDGEVFSLGSVKVKVIHTPGHTMESSCFQLTDSANKDVALFSGDTVFLGEVGRPDLACSGNITSADLAGYLYDSVQKVRKLQPTMRLYPGHGSGSACGKAIGAGNYCTVGNQNTNNYGFKFANKEEFIKQLTANLPKPPKYFFYDADLNQRGPQITYDAAMKKAHISLTPDEFLKLKDKYALLDARTEPADGFVKGAYWLPLAGPVCNFISHFIPPEQQFIIICDLNMEIEIINRLFRIGYFKVKGYTCFDMCQLKAVEKVKVNKLNFDTLFDIKERTHVDVRNPEEQESSGIIDGALSIPLPELESRLNELKGKKNIILNCMTGVRATAAYSVLVKHDIPCNVLKEDFKEFKNKGLNLMDFKAKK